MSQRKNSTGEAKALVDPEPEPEPEPLAVLNLSRIPEVAENAWLGAVPPKTEFTEDDRANAVRRLLQYTAPAVSQRQLYKPPVVAGSGDKELRKLVKTLKTELTDLKRKLVEKENSCERWRRRAQTPPDVEQALEQREAEGYQIGFDAGKQENNRAQYEELRYRCDDRVRGIYENVQERERQQVAECKGVIDTGTEAIEECEQKIGLRDQDIRFLQNQLKSLEAEPLVVQGKSAPQVKPSFVPQPQVAVAKQKRWWQLWGGRKTMKQRKNRKNRKSMKSRP